MVTKLFDPEEFNAAFKNLKIFSDGQGEDKLTSEGFASMNFDGLIPIEVDNFPAASIVPGMHISLTGSSDSTTFYQVTSVTESDSDLTASPTQVSYIEYLGDNEEVNILETSSSNVYSIFYENWDDKYLGTTGWYISSEGNAIFSNVAIRGRVEATEGSIEGDLTLGGSFTASTNNGFLIISASGINSSTASGSFNVNNIDGSVQISGDIVATSGEIEALRVGGKYFPIKSIFGVYTSSATVPERDSGQFLMTTDEFSPGVPPDPAAPSRTRYRVLSVGQTFEIEGSSASGIFYQSGTGYTNFNFFDERQFKVISASYSVSSENIYLCKIDQDNATIASHFDLGDLAAYVSGSYSVGNMFFGRYEPYSIFLDPVFIEGFIFNQLGAGSYFENYIPDYLDVGGELKLASGNIVYKNTETYISGNIHNIKPVHSVSSSVFYIPVNNERSLFQNESTFYTESLNNYIFEINSPVSSSVILDIAGNDNNNVGTEFTFTNIGGTNITFLSTASWITINSYLNKKTLSGSWSSATLRKRDSYSWILSGDLS